MSARNDRINDTSNTCMHVRHDIDDDDDLVLSSINSRLIILLVSGDTSLLSVVRRDSVVSIVATVEIFLVVDRTVSITTIWM